VLTGLMAGLYFAFDVAVMPGLRAADDHTFVTAMQSVNRAIENPLFFVAFTGPLVLPAVAAVRAHRRGRRAAAGWLGAAAVLYAATVAVTTGVNVPLNNRLATAGPADAAAARHAFEGLWTATNALRTAGCLGALGCLLAAGRRG
jgi:uncharacterized membrane protein